MLCSKPKICLVGPMPGLNKRNISQNEILKSLFTKEGYTIYATSIAQNKILRVFDMMKSLIIWRKRIDIVIISVFSGPSFVWVDITSLIAKLLNKKLILFIHGGYLPFFYERYPKWVTRIFKRADLLIAPSDYLANFFCQHSFIVHIIPNPISIKEYPCKQRSKIKPNLFWMRAFEDTYNPMMAVYVLLELQKTFHDVTLTMAGNDDGLLDKIKKLVEAKKVGKYVSFAGFLDMNGKIKEFNLHDIFINTSKVDNAPKSLIEAAALGTPIVSTNVGGIPYLFKDNETALLVEDGDTNGMVGAIKKLLQKPDLAERISINARRLAETHDWEIVKLKWEKIFEMLSNENRAN